MSIRLILVIAIVCLYGFLLRPWWADYKGQEKTLENHKAQIASLKMSLKELKELEEAPDDQEWERLLVKIPVDKEQEQVIRDLKRISESSGFTFKSLSFGMTPDTQSKAERLSVNFAVKGEYDRLFYFLNLIQNNPRYIGIKDLRLTSQRQKSADESRVANVTLALFVLHQQ